MKITKLLSFALLAGLIAFSGCKEEDDAVTDSSSIVGTWAGGCEAESNSSPTTYMSTVITIASTSFSIVDSMHGADSTCDATIVNFTQSMDLTYTEGSTGTDSASGKTYTELDIVFGASTITPKTQVQADEFIANSKCGFTDWAVDVAKDISGTQGCDAPPSGYAYYMAYILETNTLYLSNDDTTNTGETAATRAIAFDLTQGMTRQ